MLLPETSVVDPDPVEFATFMSGQKYIKILEYLSRLFDMIILPTLDISSLLS